MVWKYKPWWCQPWSIILTGITILTASWFLLHSLIVTIILSLLIVVWWIYFLVIYPKLMAEIIDSQKS